MTTNNGHGTPYPTRTMAEKDPARRAPAPQSPKGGLLWLCGIIFVVILAGLVAFTLVHRSQAQAELNSSTRQMAAPTVLVVQPQKGDSQVHLTLPGTVQAEMESSVYAQVSGYIKRWLVDIGGPVNEGQLLAEIETPVTDQQLLQAIQSVNQAQANLEPGEGHRRPL